MSHKTHKTHKKPCCICHRWFLPDPRVGDRQRACQRPECQKARKAKSQARWLALNPEYFVKRRIQQRNKADTPDPPRVPAPLQLIPWAELQGEIEGKATDIVAQIAKVLLSAVKDEIRQYRQDIIDELRRLLPRSEKDEIPAMANSLSRGGHSAPPPADRPPG